MNVPFIIILSLLVVLALLLQVDWGHVFGREVVSKKISLERELTGGQLADLADQIQMVFEPDRVAFLESNHGKYYSSCEKDFESDQKCWTQWMLLTPDNVSKLNNHERSYRFREFWRLTFCSGKKNFLRCKISYFNKEHDYHEYLFFEDEFYNEIELICEPAFVKVFWNRSRIEEQKRFLDLMEMTIRRISN